MPIRQMGRWNSGTQLGLFGGRPLRNPPQRSARPAKPLEFGAIRRIWMARPLPFPGHGDVHPPASIVGPAHRRLGDDDGRAGRRAGAARGLRRSRPRLRQDRRPGVLLLRRSFGPYSVPRSGPRRRRASGTCRDRRPSLRDAVGHDGAPSSRKAGAHASSEPSHPAQRSSTLKRRSPPAVIDGS
jgi:hypothetical protein